MAEVVELNVEMREEGEQSAPMAGLATEAREHRPTEMLRTQCIVINFPEEPQESSSNIVLRVARM